MSEVAEVTSESPRAGDKTSDMKISATKGLDSKIFEKQEDAEEEKGEHDPEVTPAEPEVLKKPSARAVPAAAAAKKQDSKPRAHVIQSIAKKGSWKVDQYETAKGRKYWKWCHPDGKQYWFSKVQAQQHGFVDEDAA